MTIGIADSIRTTRMTDISTAIDAGAGVGTIKIYDGVRPAKGGTVTTLLATLTFSDPCAASVTAGVLTFDTITDDTSADASGTATWGRIEDSNSTFVIDCSVGGPASGEDVELNSAVIASGATVSITSAAITDSGA